MLKTAVNYDQNRHMKTSSVHVPMILSTGFSVLWDSIESASRTTPVNSGSSSVIDSAIIRVVAIE